MEIENYENIQLIIFDCDGVLIDSEIISAKVISMQFNKLGIDIDTQYVQKHFIGQSYLKVKGHVLKNFNIQLADNFEEEYRVELLKVFDKELKIVPGIENILKQLNIQKCVATSSSKKRATSSLKTVGIYEYLKDNIFSAYNLGDKGKPAPDIYLNSAKKFNIEPQNVLVIEDSLVGIEGAKKAGMKTWHFIGASHLITWDRNHQYSYEPDFVFDDMNKFFDYLPHLSINNKKEEQS